MNALPQLNSDCRAPRFNLADITPAVLRFEDGRRTQAQLEVISLTGGMLYVPGPLQQDSQVKLMFVTPTGPVLATAEMLRPVALGKQPFRFVTLEQDDRWRLQVSIQSSFGQARNEEWIEKYRATLDHRRPEKRALFQHAPGRPYSRNAFPGQRHLPLRYLQRSSEIAAPNRGSVLRISFTEGARSSVAWAIFSAHPRALIGIRLFKVCFALFLRSQVARPALCAQDQGRRARTLRFRVRCGREFPR